MSDAKYLKPVTARAIAETVWTEGERVRQICLACANAWGIHASHIINSSRSHTYANARQAAYLIARSTTGHSFPELGRLFRRDKTTVINGVRSAAKRLATNDLFRERFLAAMTELER